jgi:hypothetical protein
MMPNGASANGAAFSSGACGAWSVARIVIVAVDHALDHRVHVRLLAQGRVHLGGGVEARRTPRG